MGEVMVKVVKNQEGVANAHPDCPDNQSELCGLAAQCGSANMGKRLDRKKPAVLLIESDPFFSTALMLGLENSGLIVIKAVDGLEGKILYRQYGEALQAVLANINISHIGVEKLALHNLQNHNLPFVVHSGVHDQEMATKLTALGVGTHVLKGSSIRPVIRVLKAAISRKSRRIRRDANCPLNTESGILTLDTKMDEVAYVDS